MKVTYETELILPKELEDKLQELGNSDFADDFVIYGEDKNGDIHPIATMIKHPDCPNRWYEWLYEKMKKKDER